MQQWAQFALLSSYEIFRTAASTINVLGILLSHFNQIWGFSTDFFIQVPSMKFHGNRAVGAALIRADSQTDGYT
jgi:predicted permease